MDSRALIKNGLKTFTLLVLLLLSQHSLAQLKGISYQAVAIDEANKQVPGIDNTGSSLVEKTIGLRFTILNGSNGPIYYQETQVTSTDKFGLFSVVIGEGSLTALGSFSLISDIPWSTGNQFLKVELDLKNVGDFKIMSNQQFMAVPYAFYALNTGSTTTPPITLTVLGNSLSVEGGNTVVLPSPTLSLNGASLSINGSNAITLPAATPQTITSLGIASVTNGINSATISVPNPTLTLIGNNLSVNGGNTITLPAAAAASVVSSGAAITTTLAPNSYSIDVPKPILTVNGSSLSVNGGNTVILPSAIPQTIIPQGALTVSTGLNSFTISAPAQTAQTIIPQGIASITNGINSATVSVPNPTLTLSGTNLSINGGNTITLPAQTAQTITPLGIASVTNGINSATVSVPNPTLTLSGANLSINGGNTITLPTQTAQTITPLGIASVTNGLNSATVSVPNPTLSLNGANLSINGGNTITLPAQTAQTITPLGIASVTNGINSATVSVPNPTLTLTGANLSINGGNTITLPSSIPQTITPLGIASVTNGLNSATVSVPNPTLSLNGANLSINGGNTITLPAQTAQTITPIGIASVTNGINSATVSVPNPTLTLTGANLSINGGNTITLPSSIPQTITPQGAITVSTGLNSFTINAPAQTAQTLIPQGIASITNGINSATLSVPNPTLTLNGNNLSVSGGNTVTLAAATIASLVTSGAAVTTTLTLNSYSINVPQPTLTVNGSNLSVSGGNTVTLPSAIPQTITPLGAVTVSAGLNSFTISAPAQITQTLIPNGIASVTNGLNSATVSVPNPTLTLIGANLSINGGNTITLPSATAQTLTPQGIASVTNGVNSATVNVPNPTLTLSGNNLSVSGGNTITLPAAAGASIVTSGAASTTTLSANSYSINVPQPTLTVNGSSLSVSGGNTVTLPSATPQTITPLGALSVSTGVNSFTISAPAQTTQTLIPQGIASVTNGLNSATISVPNPILSLSGNNLSVSGGNTVTLTSYSDSQSLSIVGNNLSISNGNTVALPGSASPSLAINGNSLSLVGGNTINLPSGTMPNGTAAGQMLYWDGSAWVTVAPGTTGQNLTFCNGIPTWGPCPVLATISTNAATSITDISAIVGGNVTNQGGAAVTSRGVCWALTANPTITNSILSNGSGLGSFTSTLTGLIPNTTYYVRAYATSIAGTAYGSQVSFLTLSLPTVTTTAISSIFGTYAYSGGNVTFGGNTAVTARGVCWSTSPLPTTSNSLTADGSGLGAFFSNMTSLTPNTTYYVRAYAVNTIGIAYGNQFNFTTLNYPTVVSDSINQITCTSANLFGNLTSSGGELSVTKGFCVGTTPNPTIQCSSSLFGYSVGTYSSNSQTSYCAYNLIPGTVYYVRAFAMNSAGTVYGAQLTFTTVSAVLPAVTTGTVNNISGTWAQNNNTVTSDGCAPVTSRGLCWNTSPNPTTSNSFTVTGFGTGSYFSTISGSLSLNTTYYFRAFATNSVGTSYGNQVVITTQNIPTVITTSVSTISGSSENAAGNISNDGGLTVTQRGFCWGTSANPTTANSFTIVGSGLGTYTSTISGLSGNTTYHIRAYAINGAGTGYGNDVTFTTAPSAVPTLSTISINNIEKYNIASWFSASNQTNCALNTTYGLGNILDDGGATITDKGICWSTSANPTTANSYSSAGAGLGSFNGYFNGLTVNTVYYVRAYATNSAGTGYGNQITFTTTSVFLGQSYQGGIVAYILSAADPGYVIGQTHGLIITSSDVSTGIRWSTGNTFLTTSSAIGTGSVNTDAIVAAMGTATCAARSCYDLVSGTYSDWFLPSSGEMGAMFPCLGLGNYYWTSTAGYVSPLAPSYRAVKTAGGSSGAYDDELNLYYVRAVRKF